MGEFDALLEQQNKQQQVGEFDHLLESGNKPAVPYNTDTYTQLKQDALKLGYSGLSPEQQQMIKDAYPSSLAGKAGRPFAEMTKQMDEQAGVGNPELAGVRFDLKTRPIGEASKNVYGATKEFLTQGIAPVTATVSYATDKLFGQHKPVTSPETGEVVAVPDNRDWESYYNEALNKGHEGSGVTGFLSNPIAYAPGINTSKLVGGISNTLLRGGANAGIRGAENLAYNTASNALEDRDLSEGAGLSGGLGALFGFAGGTLGHSVPGMRKYNEAVEAGKAGASRKLTTEEARDALANMGLPTQGSFERYSAGLSKKAGGMYDEAIDVVSPLKLRMGDMVDKVTNEKIPAYVENTGLGKMFSPNNINQASLRDELYADIVKRNSSEKLGLTSKEISKYVDDYIERLNMSRPDFEMGQENLVKRLGSKKNPTGVQDLSSAQVSPRELNDTKKFLNNDIYAPKVGEGAHQRRVMGQTIKESINERIKGATPEAGAGVDKSGVKKLFSDADKLYSTSKTLDKTTDYVSKEGLPVRLGHDGLAAYFKINPQYAVPWIASREGGINRLTRGLHMRDKDNKK